VLRTFLNAASQHKNSGNKVRKYHNFGNGLGNLFQGST